MVCIKFAFQETKELYLAEVRQCFDGKFNLISCQKVMGSKSNCPRDKIIYPKSPKIFKSSTSDSMTQTTKHILLISIMFLIFKLLF